jgi:hypothetical protein
MVSAGIRWPVFVFDGVFAVTLDVAFNAVFATAFGADFFGLAAGGEDFCFVRGMSRASIARGECGAENVPIYRVPTQCASSRMGFNPHVKEESNTSPHCKPTIHAKDQKLIPVGISNVLILKGS